MMSDSPECRQAGFAAGAFYKLADALRLHSPRLDDALRAYHWFVRGRGDGADWLGFMVSTFGLEACKKLKEPQPAEQAA